jgi:hypothetical protein
MTESYYDQLESGDPARAAGWRDAIDQALRFSVALDWMPTEAHSVLDLGCGLGSLGVALGERRPHARYQGIDQREASVRRGRQLFGVSLDRGDIFSQRIAPADYVVSIGTMVGGASWEGRQRVQAAQRLLARSFALAQMRACIILLKEEALDERPSMRLERSLGGLYSHELSSLLDEITPFYRVLGDTLLHEHVIVLDRHPSTKHPEATQAERVRSLSSLFEPTADRAVGVAIEGCAFGLARERLSESGTGSWQQIMDARLKWAESFIRSPP